MRILHVTPFYYPAYQYGGIPRIVHELSVSLKQRGHEITVYTSDCLDAKSRYRCDGNCRTVDGITAHYFKNFSNWLAYHFLFPLPTGMMRHVRETIHRYDVVHLWSHRHVLNNIALMSARRKGVPCVFSAQGSTLRLERRIWQKRIFDLLLGNKVLRNVRRYVATTRSEIQEYRQAGIHEDKIVVVPNGIDTKGFVSLPPEGRFKRRLGITGKRIILYVGRISPRKGIDTLIEAYAHLRNDDVVLVIAGNDMGFMAEARRIVKATNQKDRVVFTGYLDDAERNEAYVDSAVVAYPGVHEIFGLVAFEALMCGTPVVVADDSGCGELVAEARGGMVFKAGSSHDLKEKLQRLLDDREMSDRYVENGRNYIRSYLDWPVVAGRMEDVYQNVCS